MLRIAVIPVIAWCYITRERPTLAVLFLLISGFTDIADGFIARRFNMISNFGKALDPVADKLTQFALLVCLTMEIPEMIIPCALLTVKEIVSAFTALRAIRQTGKVDGANWHGKLSTVVIYTMLFTHILWSDVPKYISLAFIIVSAVTMILSFAMYNVRNIRAYKTNRESMCA